MVGMYIENVIKPEQEKRREGKVEEFKGLEGEELKSAIEEFE